MGDYIQPPIYLCSIVNGEEQDIGTLEEFESTEEINEQKKDYLGIYGPVTEYMFKFKMIEGRERLLWKLGLRPEYEYKPNNWRKFHKIPLKRERKTSHRPEEMHLYEITAKPEFFTWQDDKRIVYLPNERTQYEIIRLS